MHNKCIHFSKYTVIGNKHGCQDQAGQAQCGANQELFALGIIKDLYLKQKRSA